MVQLMQDASMQNVLKLKASVWDLEDRKISWVLLRKELQVIRKPLLGESIRILTYPAGFDRVFAYRDYKVFDQQNHLIAYAGTTWTLMHTEKRTMVRIPTEIFDFDASSQHELLPRPENKIPVLQKSEFETSFKVGYYDLDWNGHVNNVFLIRCISEGLPDDLLKTGVLKNLNIQFKNESLWKDHLWAQFQQIDEKTCLHRIQREKDQKTIALAKSVWE